MEKSGEKKQGRGRCPASGASTALGRAITTRTTGQGTAWMIKPSLFILFLLFYPLYRQEKHLLPLPTCRQAPTTGGEMGDGHCFILAGDTSSGTDGLGGAPGPVNNGN